MISDDTTGVTYGESRILMRESSRQCAFAVGEVAASQRFQSKAEVDCQIVKSKMQLPGK
jgi:hypothetical protein